jgi:NADPH:quinone reductase-like Zn-dependent oxidoreductase
MRAVYLERHGGPEVLGVKELPEPVPGPGEALVEVRACGLNHLDIWVRLGGKRSFPLPLIPGSDAAGVVLEAPAGSGLAEGDEVVLYPADGCGRCVACERGDEQLCTRFRIYGAARDGGLAQRITVPARNLVPKPPSLSFTEAASVAVNYITAYHMLTARAAVRPGEKVLIQAAGSGVSTAAIPIATALGAEVIATSSTPKKLLHASSCGARAVVNYRTENIAARVQEFTDGRGADVVFDHVGKPNWATNLASLAKGGRLVFCGVTGGNLVEVDLQSVYFQGQSLLGSTMGTIGELRTVLSLMATGRFRPIVDRVFTLDQIVAAHRYLESGEQTGKVVLEVSRA